MRDVAEKPRSSIGIVAIALLLGVVPLMLWIGRWRAALFYTLVGPVIVALFVLAFVPRRFDFADSLSLEDVIPLGFSALSLLGILHALFVRRAALGRPWYSRWYVALVIFPVLQVLAALLIAFCIRTFLFQPFDIPSASMYPTLKVGDFILVSKRSYGDGTSPADFPKRGDLVVVKQPTDPNVDYVKRVIGLPGDHVQIRDGIVFINEVPVKKERIEDFFDQDGNGDFNGRPIPQFLETLDNGVSYRVLEETPNGTVDNTNGYIVPEGHYFLMGDNRDNSQDSRFLNEFGYVPLENFVGRVTLRFWSKDKSNSTVWVK